MKFPARSWILILGLIALLAIPRLTGIDSFATIDEPYWLTAGSDFYYALGQRDLANTIYDYHPAVTTTWIVATAMLLYFPQYRGLGQGYFDVYKDSLERFLLSHDHTPLGLLTAARILQVLLIVLLLALVFWLLRRLLGAPVAIAGTLLIGFDPFFLGHSRLLNHEAMLSLFVVVSLLAMLVHLISDSKWGYLIMSGAAAGLAQLTKSSSIVLVPLVAGLFLLDVLIRRESDLGKRVLRALAGFGAWLGMLAVVYVALWPGMWVAPAQMLSEVFGNAFSYAFEGARLSALEGTQTPAVQLSLGDIGPYLQSVLWRTTPIVWLGVLLGFVSAFRENWERRLVLAAVFLIGALFMILFGVAGGRNSAHYVLTSYVALDIIAAVGLGYLANTLAGRSPWRRSELLPVLIIGAAVFLQAASALAFFPYYYIYYSPVMEALQPGQQDPNFGYGEGLDLAAAYLAGKPSAADSTVTAFYGRGPFSYFYPGKTEPLKPIYADAENVPQLEEILHKSDYLVIYYALEKGRDSPANVMRALPVAEPEKTIWLNGFEYVRIYRMAAMPPSFYEQLQP